jgi:hypothetical protein
LESKNPERCEPLVVAMALELYCLPMANLLITHCPNLLPILGQRRWEVLGTFDEEQEIPSFSVRDLWRVDCLCDVRHNWM